MNWTLFHLPRKPRIAVRLLLKSDLCSNTHMTPCVSQPIFCWLCCILVPSFHLLWRQGDWMKTFLCLSFFGCAYPLFHVVGRSVKGTYQNKTVRLDVWSLCQRMFSHSYSTVLSQKYQPCIVSNIDFSFKINFIDCQKCGFYLNISTDLFHYLFLRVSHWTVTLKYNSQWWDSNFLRTGYLTPGLTNNRFYHYRSLQRCC